MEVACGLSDQSGRFSAVVELRKSGQCPQWIPKVSTHIGSVTQRVTKVTAQFRTMNPMVDQGYRPNAGSDPTGWSTWLTPKSVCPMHFQAGVFNDEVGHSSLRDGGDRANSVCFRWLSSLSPYLCPTCVR